AVLGDNAELGGDLVAGGSRELDEIARFAGNEEHRVADAEPELFAQCAGALRPEILRDRSRAALLAVAPEDIAETGLTLALGPFVHAVAKRAIAALGRRNAPYLDLWIGGDHAGKNLEARATEVRSDVLHPDGVAQIRLVGSVLPH